MKSTYDLTVIIVNYNSAAFLQQCLSSLCQQQNVALQIIVVDNNSTDNSTKLVESKFPQVQLIKRHTSIGFSAANNAGVALAKADHLLFLNPDTQFTHPHTLRRCLDKYNQTFNIGILTPKIELALTHTIDQTCHRGFPTPWASLTYFTGLAKLFPHSSLFGQYYLTYLDYRTEHDIDSAGGMFMLISRRLGDQVGWWDEDYPLYGEDIDLCYRVKQAGFRIVYWPQETVLHYKGVSTGMSKQSQKVSTASPSTTKQVKIWSTIAMEIFYRKHLSHRYPFFINWLVYAGIKLLKFKRVYWS